MDKNFGIQGGSQGVSGNESNFQRLAKYCEEVFHPEDALLKEIRSRSVMRGVPQIHVGKMDGLHIEVLARAFNAKKSVEIGTLVGYSGICLLRGMGPEGKLHTFEADAKHAKLAQENFEKAQVADRVKIYQGDALQRLKEAEAEGPFDLVFIDADKLNYPAYLDWATENLRVGGVVVGDNTFAWGMIADTEFESEEDRLAVTGLREFNAKLALPQGKGGRFLSTILPTGEGLTLGVKLR